MTWSNLQIEFELNCDVHPNIIEWLLSYPNNLIAIVRKIPLPAGWNFDRYAYHSSYHSKWTLVFYNPEANNILESERKAIEDSILKLERRLFKNKQDFPRGCTIPTR